MVNWSKKNVLTNKNHGITPSIWWRDGGICGCATLFKQTPLPKWILEEDISPIPICTYLKVPEGFYPSENTRGRERGREMIFQWLDTWSIPSIHKFSDPWWMSPLFSTTSGLDEWDNPTQMSNVRQNSAH